MGQWGFCLNWYFSHHSLKMSSNIELSGMHKNRQDIFFTMNTARLNIYTSAIDQNSHEEPSKFNP